MLKITHIINPVKVNESSDLFVAQPITFESMKADYPGLIVDRHVAVENNKSFDRAIKVFKRVRIGIRDDCFTMSFQETVYG